MMYGKDLKRRSRKTLGGKSVEQPAREWLKKLVDGIGRALPT
jgi:hypothetical protein